jgi:hypothetical protein
LSYLVMTARLRLSRPMPHSTAWRCLYLSLSNAGGLPPELPFFFRLATWSFFSGMVQRMPRRRSQARLAREP